MMKKFILFLFVFFPIKLEASVVDDLQNKYSQISDWRAEFTQETYVDLLKKHIKKNGEVLIKKPGKVRIEYSGKSGKQYVSNGKKLWIYTPGDPDIMIYKNVSKLMAKEALTFLKGLGQIHEQFTTTKAQSGVDFKNSFKNKNLELVLLKPKNKSDIIQKIIIGIDAKDSLVKEMIFYNTSGNSTHYVFKNIILNSNLNENLFSLE